jgi:hypothetical protein
MRMKKILVLTLVLTMVLACGFVFAQEEKAAPTGQLGSCWLGPSGLILVPTAETLGLKEGRASVLTTKWTVKNGDINEYDIAVGYGATDNLEVGIGAKMFKNDETVTNPLVFAKYALPISSSEKLPAAFAAGATYWKQGDIDKLKWEQTHTIVYAVASASLSKQIKGHLGLGLDKWEADNDDGTEFLYFAGLEGKLMPALTVSIETLKLGGKDADNTNALGLRYAVTPKIAVTGAAVDWGTDKDDYQYYLGVAYNW